MDVILGVLEWKRNEKKKEMKVIWYFLISAAWHAAIKCGISFKRI